MAFTNFGGMPGIPRPTIPKDPRTSPKVRGKPKDTRSALDKEIDKARSRLDKHLEEGRDRGQQLFGNGVDLQGMNRETMMALQNQMTGGLAAPNLQSIRTNAVAGLQSQNANNLRNLQIANGANGVRGAAAQAGTLRAMQQSDIARRGLEADLAGKDLDARLSGLSGLRDAVGQERYGQLATEFGYGELGSTVDNNAMTYLASLQNLKRARGGVDSQTIAPGEIPKKVTPAVDETGKKIGRNPWEQLPEAGGNASEYLKKRNPWGG